VESTKATQLPSVTIRMHLTTNAAAELAGVTASTVKRWADLGVLPCVRTAGGHRRFERFSFERFLREQASTGSGPNDALLGPWLEPLRNGRRHEVDGLLLDARARLGAWHLVADEVGAFLTAFGREWECGRIAVADEHLVSEGLARALGRVAGALPTHERGPRCVLACVEGDEHTLGLSLAELCLWELGWTTLWLGRRTPTSETARFAVDCGAQMVALSASSASSDRALLRNVVDQITSSCRSRDIELVLGGAGAWPEATTYAVRMRSFGAFHHHVVQRRERS
jgi:excisionase family DNA binding protein